MGVIQNSMQSMFGNTLGITVGIKNKLAQPKEQPMEEPKVDVNKKPVQTKNVNPNVYVADQKRQKGMQNALNRHNSKLKQNQALRSHRRRMRGGK